MKTPDRIDTIAAAFIASGRGPKGETTRIAWAYKWAVDMVSARCRHVGHTFVCRKEAGEYVNVCIVCDDEEIVDTSQG